MTIVAAWMSAETGVGPSIASGSQTWRGICALLPHAPTKSSSATTVSGPNSPHFSGWSAPAPSVSANVSKVPKE